MVFFYCTTRQYKATSKTPKLFLLIFAIALSVSFGVFWEMYEWFMLEITAKQFFTMTLQDTILDLVADTVGAVVVAFVYYFTK